MGILRYLSLKDILRSMFHWLYNRHRYVKYQPLTESNYKTLINLLLRPCKLVANPNGFIFCLKIMIIATQLPRSLSKLSPGPARTHPPRTPFNLRVSTQPTPTPRKSPPRPHDHT